MCLRCKPNFDNHTPSKCPRRCYSNKQLGHRTFNNKNNGNGHKINQHTEPNLQLSVLSSKPDQMAELLEATRKMTTYFKRSVKHNSSHPNKTSNYQSNTSVPHADKHKYKSHYHTPNHIATETDNMQENTDLDSSDSTVDSTSGSE